MERALCFPRFRSLSLQKNNNRKYELAQCAVFVYGQPICLGWVVSFGFSFNIHDQEGSERGAGFGGSNPIHPSPISCSPCMVNKTKIKKICCWVLWSQRFCVSDFDHLLAHGWGLVFSDSRLYMMHKLLLLFFKWTLARQACRCGAVAQMVERSLSMREAQGSIPCSSNSIWGPLA